MSGVRPEWIAGTDFIMLHLDLVDALGGSLEAALLLNRILFRGGPEGWVATKAEIQADTRLTEWKLDRAIKELRDAGFVTSDRVSSFDPTQRWIVVFEEEGTSRPVQDATSRTVRDETSSTSITKNIRTTTPPTPPPGDPSISRSTAGGVTKMEPDWRPDPSTLEDLQVVCPLVDLNRTTSDFINWHISEGKTSRNWDAKFRTWVARKQVEREKDLDGTDEHGVPLRGQKPRLADDGDPAAYEAMMQAAIDHANRAREGTSDDSAS